MSQDSIGVVTTGTMKATGMEDNSETKPLPHIERHSYSEVGWISRQILSASGRGRTFFLTSLFIELIDRVCGEQTAKACANAFYEKVIKVKADVAAYLININCFPSP